MDTTDLRYPIGKFEPKESYTPEEVSHNILRISLLPEKIGQAVQGLSVVQLDTPYREGGWTLRQVAHHVVDSHMNAYIRIKWTLTEDSPLIKAYDEKAWAETPETKADPNFSLTLLKALHAKWVILLKGLHGESLDKYFIHPDTKKQVPIARLIAMYAWHGEHHTAHITSLREKMNW